MTALKETAFYLGITAGVVLAVWMYASMVMELI
jgi:hypothetical protein